jgi:outer membrane biosynthesis protein TonB
LIVPPVSTGDAPKPAPPPSSGNDAPVVKPITAPPPVKKPEPPPAENPEGKKPERQKRRRLVPNKKRVMFRTSPFFYFNSVCFRLAVFNLFALITLCFSRFRRQFFAGNRKYNQAPAAPKNAPNHRTAQAANDISLRLR